MCRHVVLSWMGMVAAMGAASANADRQLWDYSGIAEVTIDRPAKDVWPYLFGAKEESWTKQHYTHIAGEPGKVGEIYVYTFPGGQLFYEAINVKPEKQLVLKISYRQNEKGESRLAGYDYLTLNEVAGHTTVVLQQMAALPVDMPNSDLSQASEKQDTMLADIFQTLKKTVESGVGAAHPEEGRKIAEADLISTAHWALHTELTLDRRLSEVWPVFKDMRRWYTEYTFENVSGPSYQASSGLQDGQVLKLTRASDDGAGSQPFIYAKTVKVAPQKEIVVVLFGPAHGWSRYSDFYVLKMTQRARHTTIFVDSYVEAELVKPLPKGEFSDYHDQFTRDWQHSWSEAFVNLSKVISADK
jgi:hypothetical protein